MSIKVKICGIRTLEAAQTAINAGADFLGFNFISTSKRYINPELAKKIIGKLKKSAKIVGVFQNEKASFINKSISDLDLDYVQLHEKKIIKSMKDKAIYLLIDRKKQGAGQIPDLDKAKTLAQRSKIFFAGGLDPNNVAEIVKKVKPYAVDVAGGIETNGIQDSKKIKSFIKKVKGVII